MQPIVLDFETEGIESRPNYPPKPVGLAVYDPMTNACNYHAFNHVTGNNCTKDIVKTYLSWAYSSGRPLVFHNAMFDLDVIETHFGLAIPHHTLLHDTLILAFLHDPHVRSLALKDLVVDYNLAKPEERDELRDWIIINVPEAKRKKSTWGAHICKAPVNLVSRYAMADVRLTYQLLTFLHDKVLPAQKEPYYRELELIAMLLENSRLGVRVDQAGLQQAKEQAEKDIEASTVIRIS